jgi:ABC-2 type transport system permease protein
MEQFRTRRFLVVFVVLLVFGMLSPLTAKFMGEVFKLIPGAEQFAGLIPPPTITDAVAQYVKNISQFIVIMALLVSMGAVAVEKEKGTAAIVLVKPMPRSTFLLTKFLALTFTFGTSLLAAAIAAYYYTLYLFGPLDILRFLALNGLLLIYCMLFVAITLLASTLVKSQAVAAGIGFGCLLLLALIGSIPPLTEMMPDQLVRWGTLLMNGQNASYWPSMIVTCAVIVVSLAVAVLVFRKQEL